MGLAASWERQDAGSIPSLAAWWVKDLVFPQLQLRSQLWLRSDPWLGNPLCCGVAEKEKKKRERERGSVQIPRLGCGEWEPAGGGSCCPIGWISGSPAVAPGPAASV